jgi:hypothetical protein
MSHSSLSGTDRVVRVLRIVSFNNSSCRGPPAALHPPAPWPIALPVSTTLAFACRIAVFLFLFFPIIFRVGRLGRLGLGRWWTSSSSSLSPSPSRSFFAQVLLALHLRSGHRMSGSHQKQQQQSLRRRRCNLRQHTTGRSPASLTHTNRSSPSSNPLPTPPQERPDPGFSLPPPQQAKPRGRYLHAVWYGYWNWRGVRF